MMAQPVVLTRVGEGMFRVEHDGHSHIVYVAGTAQEQWVFWEGRVFVVDGRRADTAAPSARVTGPQPLTAPMPARVLSVLVQPGASVQKGDTVVLLEAMKMELPVRAPTDATVLAVHCREGELVEADAVLLELS